MALSVGEQVRWWGVGLVVAAAFLWALSGILLPFLAGAALAYFLDPLADRLEARGLSRAAATGVVTAAMLGLFLALLLLMIPAAVLQAQELVGRLPDYAAALRDWLEAVAPDQLVDGAPLAQGLDLARERLNEAVPRLLEGAWSGGLALIEVATLLVVTPVVAFYLLLDWDRMIAKIDGWIPRDHLGTVRHLAREIDAALAGFVRGQMSVCVILGTFYAAGLMLLGLDFGLAIGSVAGLISFIPYVGTLLGAATSIGVAAFQFWDTPVMILAVAGIFVAGQTVEGYFLTPRLVGRSVGLHPVALLFALSAFGSLLGFAGLLIAVPTAAAIAVLGRFAIAQYLDGRLYQGLGWQLEREARVEAMAHEAHPPAPHRPGDARKGAPRDGSGDGSGEASGDGSGDGAG